MSKKTKSIASTIAKVKVVEVKIIWSSETKEFYHSNAEYLKHIRTLKLAKINAL